MNKLTVVQTPDEATGPSDCAQKVFSALGKHADANGFVAVTDYRLSRWALIPEASVADAISELNRAGWIQVVDRSRPGRRSIYNTDVPF